MIKIRTHPQEKIFIVSLKMNLIPTQRMAITSIPIRIVVISGISTSVLEYATFFDHGMYKVCTKTVAQMAVVWGIQDQQISLLAGFD